MASAMPYSATAALKRLVRGSPLLASAGFLRDGAAAFRTRSLSAPETLQLERQGCVCGDWTRVRVQEGFDPIHVREATFEGDVSLPRFSGTVMLPGHVSLPTGIRRAHIRDAVIGNCCIHDVGLLARQVVQDAAVVFRVGSLVASGTSAFATGSRIQVGLESGGRQIPLFAEMDMELAAWLAFHPDSNPERLAFEEALASHAENIRHGAGWVGEGAQLCNTVSVRNAWIGPHARVDGAQLVRDTAVLSSIESPTQIRDGAIVEHSVLQCGVRIRTMAIVRKALFCEASGASRHAKILDAIVGANTEIQEGELTCSILGPLVGFHHQSLVIACLWPEGRGNVGHGAALGSNHTGRRADQELRPGEGQFFGLCCQVQFPSDFSQAPWSLVAMGTKVPAGSVKLPFSLVVSEPDHALVRVRPGWMWLQNAYALERAESKLGSRDRTHGKICQQPLFHRGILEKVKSARDRLLAAPGIQEWWTHSTFDAVGPGRMSEMDRKAGIDAYTECLTLITLRAVLADSDSELLAWSKAFLASEFPTFSLDDLLQRLPGLERLWLRRVRRSRERDDLKGSAVFADYALVHPPAKEDEIIRLAGARARETARLVRSLPRG
ncbi:MAG: DUF4954 family protein [Fibrobacteres bacterium]|nr:DUF4954 family protein [Fibrobacterota bacterium]